jgi:hypothetical protein
MTFRARTFVVVSLAAILAAFAGLTYQYLIHWDLAFSSDTAMIGLMGKYVAYHGERPIFVWSVGYQGMLIDAYLSAVFFRLFGMGPITACFAPTLVFWIAIPIWLAGVKRAFGLPTMVVAFLFTVVSTPLLYNLNTRMLPNFPEAFLIGAVFFWLYGTWSTAAIKSRAQTIALGALVGFGCYLFAITGYYFLAAAAHALFLRAREQYVLRGNGYLVDLALPFRPVRRGRAALKGLTYFVWTMIAWAFVTFFIPALNFTYGRVRIPGDSLIVMFAGGAILLLVSLVRWGLSAPRAQKMMAALFAAGVALGYSPALYYKFVLGGRSWKRIGVAGGWSAMWRRLEILGFTTKLITNAEAISVVGWVTTLFLLVVFAIYLRDLGRLAVRFYRIGEKSPRFDLQMPYLFLPLVMLGIFSTASMVGDEGSSRYLVFIVPVVALAVGYVTVKLWKAYSQPVIRLAWVLLLALTLVNNVYGMRKDWAASTLGARYYRLIAALDQKGITHGYADYWYAYAINFLTDERIVLQPSYSAYAPQYQKRVAGRPRLAVLMPHKDGWAVGAKEIPIDGFTYRIVERTTLAEDGVDLVVVER